MLVRRSLHLPVQGQWLAVTRHMSGKQMPPLCRGRRAMADTVTSESEVSFRRWYTVCPLLRLTPLFAFDPPCTAPSCPVVSVHSCSVVSSCVISDTSNSGHTTANKPWPEFFTYSLCCDATTRAVRARCNTSHTSSAHRCYNNNTHAHHNLERFTAVSDRRQLPPTSVLKCLLLLE